MAWPVEASMDAEGKEAVERIKAVVARHFPIYDVLVDFDRFAFYVNVDPSTLDTEFEALRLELKAAAVFPSISEKAGEHIINVTPAPRINPRSVIVNQIMLLLTSVTTVYAGAVLWASYSGSELYTLGTFANGALFFAIPLMLILGVHELSHYLTSKRHGINASLPFFIPFIPPLGTLGAFISIREPIPNRKALMDIGISGPIGGFLVTIPVTIIGLWLTAQGEPMDPGMGTGGSVMIMLQPLFQLFTLIIPIPENVALHPTGFAAWVGFLVTAINLLPAGQLDGGHIARAALGRRAKYVSYIAAAGMIALTFFYTGWFLFALLIIFLGLEHPPPLNDISPIGTRGKVLGVVGLLLFVGCFAPIPMTVEAESQSFTIDLVQGDANMTVPHGSIIDYAFAINNTGNVAFDVDVRLQTLPPLWGSSLGLQSDPGNMTSGTITVPLDYQGSETLLLSITVPSWSAEGSYGVVLHAESWDAHEFPLIINVI